MKKSAIVSMVIMCVMFSGLVLVQSTVAEKPEQGLRGLKGQAGNSNNAFIELWQKDPATWEIVEDGAWGKLKYNLAGAEFEFLFNGHGLEPGAEYSLIIYNDPWPGTGSVLLASGTACEYGNIHLAGSIELGADLADAKIWLVLSSDFDGSQMVGWNPTEYLFEYDLISYDDTDV